jgi:uncharacterized protein (TIGR03435 family)
MYCRGGPGTSDPGLFRCENWSLPNLINRAYMLGANQLSAHDWTGTTLFHIDARLPAGTTEEQFEVMLQNLLADRFKLAVHFEKRESVEYRLVVNKGGPKLKLAAKKEEPKPDAGGPPTPQPFKVDADGYPAFAPGETGTKSTPHRAHASERLTTEGLAGYLSSYLHTHVIDATGLEGIYAIDLYWVPDESPSATEAVPGPTLVEAVQKQFGLRLEKKANGTLDVLVVDHAEKVPSGN